MKNSRMKQAISEVDDRYERHGVLAHEDRLPGDKRSLEGLHRLGQHKDKAIPDWAPSLLKAALPAPVARENSAALSRAEDRAVSDEATDWAKSATRSQLLRDTTFQHSAR
jgi:hypothetical protein